MNAVQEVTKLTEAYDKANGLVTDLSLELNRMWDPFRGGYLTPDQKKIIDDHGGWDLGYEQSNRNVLFQQLIQHELSDYPRS